MLDTNKSERLHPKDFSFFMLYMTEQREKTILVIIFNDNSFRNLYLAGVPLFAYCIGKAKNFQLYSNIKAVLLNSAKKQTVTKQITDRVQNRCLCFTLAIIWPLVICNEDLCGITNQERMATKYKEEN